MEYSKCHYCHDNDAIVKCGHQCDLVSYCSQECANADYVSHRPMCIGDDADDYISSMMRWSLKSLADIMRYHTNNKAESYINKSRRFYNRFITEFPKIPMEDEFQMVVVDTDPGISIKILMSFLKRTKWSQDKKIEAFRALTCKK